MVILVTIRIVFINDFSLTYVNDNYHASTMDILTVTKG